MADKRPRAREKKVTHSGQGVHLRDEKTGMGPVGASGGPRPGSGKPGGGKPGGGITRAGGLSLPVIVIAVIAYFLFGGGGGGTTTTTSSSQSGGYGQSAYSSQGSTSGGYSSSTGQTHNTWVDSTGTSENLNTTVSSGAREKYTKLLGSGKDTVTLMVYMCGTDLESQNGMATSDLQEMAAASLGDKINLLVYTGGCKRWNNNIIDNKNNQIYQITSNGMRRLVSNDGQKAMTDPATLSAYIKWCRANYPATRYGLILWDHGGGSVSGYGYDEKFGRNVGSMDLAGINKALKDGGTQFDFIGFDACLMATAETALMLNPYADYMIASEETEPGIGWYYTNWLTDLGRNTSIATTSLGKEIVDDFVNTCAGKCRGQQTTLSVVDLAEFADTVPARLSDFSKSVSSMIANKEYKTVSNARYATREFAASTRIDQVDLAHLALNIGNSQGKELAKALRSAVKYNRTSSNMTNAYGVSIYFPYRRSTYVDKICSTYTQIGMDESYAKCIQEFASLTTSGQVATGGSSGSFGSLFDSLGGYSGGYTQGSSNSYSGSSDEIAALLNAFLGGGYGSVNGLSGSNTNFLTGRAMSTEDTVEYISDNFFGSASLTWNEEAGEYKMSLSDEQWDLVHELDLNMYYDTGKGYVNLGYDNLFSFDENGSLVADTDRNWLSINGSPVSYFHMDTIDDGENYTITGRVPALLNGERVELILVFDNDNPYGFVAGALHRYDEETETLTVAKNLTEIKDGDTLDFLADLYSYDGEFTANYYIGEQLVVDGELEISNDDIGDGDVIITYRFTDIYNQEYWADSIRPAK